MAYIGKSPRQQFVGTVSKNSFTGDGSTTTFDITNIAPDGDAELEVFVNNVRQEPGSGKAYTVGADGNGDIKRITFSAAPASADAIYVLNPGRPSALLQPADSSITAAKLSSTAISGQSTVTAASNDTILISDTSDSGNLKKATVSDLLDDTTIGGATGADFNDNVKLRFGTGNDLEVFHNASDSIINDAGTGSLKLQLGGSTKLEVVSGGATVTGTATATTLVGTSAYIAETTLTDGSAVDWDVSAKPVAKLTLGGNRTLNAPTNGVAGQFVSLLVIQDGTGSRTLSFNAVYEFKDDTAPTLTTTAAKGDLFVFRYNGSKYLEVGRNQNLTLS